MFQIAGGILLALVVIALIPTILVVGAQVLAVLVVIGVLVAAIGFVTAKLASGIAFVVLILFGMAALGHFVNYRRSPERKERIELGWVNYNRRRAGLPLLDIPPEPPRQGGAWVPGFALMLSLVGGTALASKILDALVRAKSIGRRGLS